MLTGNPAATARAEQPASLSGLMVAFLAFCCGAVVANLYYAQPIVELIAPQIGLSSANASLIVSLTQFGYALGLLLLVPLADLMENRRLVVGFTLAPIELIRHHGSSQVQVAIFALVGAVAAPIAGRLADAGHGRRLAGYLP